MRILIVSDTHRKNNTLKAAIMDNQPLDMLIHLGDSEGSEKEIVGLVNVGCKVHIIKGNNDFFSGLHSEEELNIGKYKVLITHGHLYGVSLGVEQLRIEAIARNFDIAMFGHTHRPYYEADNGVILLNPGSMSYPRQDGRNPSYMLMETDKNGEAHFALNFIKK